MPKLINIPKNILSDMYLKQLLSSYQIAKKLNCSQPVIIDRLKLFKIPTRTIQQGKALTPPRYERKNFDGTLEDKAYLIGFRLGDLNISKTHPNSPTIRVSSNSTKEEQIMLIKQLFVKYGHVKIIGPDKKGATNIRCFLNQSFNFLIPKGSKIPEWVLKSKKNSFSFYAGYIDAEGCFSINHRNQPVFCINSQDKDIMAIIHSHILPLIDVKTRLYFMRPAGSFISKIRSNKDVFGIYVYNRKDLSKILRVIFPLLKHLKRRNDALKILKLINHVRS